MSTDSEASPPRTTYKEVLAEPRFRLLFLARSVATTVDSLRIATFSVLVFATTGSALMSAIAFGIGFLPQLFGTTLVGSLADRMRPRGLIVGGYVLESLTALMLAAFRMPVWASLGLVALVAFVTPVFSGASGRLVAQWLTGDAYVLGRSLSNIAASATQLLGLALGGVAVATLGARQTMAVGAAVYLMVAAAVRLGLPDMPPDTQASESVVRSSIGGTTALLRARGPRRLFLAQWLPVAFAAGAEALIIAYAGERHFASGTYAVLMASLPVGMLLGDFAVGRLLLPRVREQLVAPLVIVMGLPLLVFAIGPSLVASAVLLLIAGIGFAYALGLQQAFLDALPAEAQGQAFGLLGSGMMTLQGIGPACFGAIAAGAGTESAIALAGVATVLTACWIAIWHRPGRAATATV